MSEYLYFYWRGESDAGLTIVEANYCRIRIVRGAAITESKVVCPNRIIIRAGRTLKPDDIVELGRTCADSRVGVGEDTWKYKKGKQGKY